LRLADDQVVNLLASLDLVHQLVPLPECLQRASMFDSWTPLSSLASSLIASPAKKPLEKLNRDIVEAFGGIFLNKPAVSKMGETLAVSLG
jgi:hypothetical protein